MTDTRELDHIAAQFNPGQDVSTGKWFGMPCLKVSGKVFAALWGSDMVFKLKGQARSEALQVEGARLFDPRGKGQPMKEWVQVPVARSSTWSRLAGLAWGYVAGAAQAKKDEIISGLVEARSKIIEAASALLPAEQDRVFLGVWSVKDLLAHLTGWDWANIEAVEAILAGRLPAFYAHHDRDWKTFNARLVAEHKKNDFADLVTSVRHSHQKLIDLLRTIPAEEFDRDRGVRFKGYKVTIARTLQTEVDDEIVHHAQIEEFKDNPSKEE